MVMKYLRIFIHLVKELATAHAILSKIINGSHKPSKDNIVQSQ